MLHRQTGRGTLLISQPSHAWMSGQIAAAWGNDAFGAIEPFVEGCLAAEQHDIGWLDWEAAPTLNPETGLPRTFRELPTLEHVGVWAPAGPIALVYGPYVALLVSRHGTGLYRFHNFARDTVQEAKAARQFVQQGAAFEAMLIEGMTDSARYSRYIDQEKPERNSRLIAVWDALSLMLCGGHIEEYELTNVPAASDSRSLVVQRVVGHSERYSITPWPFEATTVTLTCAGRLINSTFTESGAMREAITRAPWQTLDIELTQGDPIESV